MISAINENINHLLTKVTTGKGKSILKVKDKIITGELKILHNKFVVVLINKARANVAFVYQIYYARVLVNEPGLNNVDNITTYMKATKQEDKILSDNTLKNKFNLQVTQIDHKTF